MYKASTAGSILQQNLRFLEFNFSTFTTYIESVFESPFNLNLDFSKFLVSSTDIIIIFRKISMIRASLGITRTIFFKIKNLLSS